MSETDPVVDAPVMDEAVTRVGLLLEVAAGLATRVDAQLRRDSDITASTYEVLVRLHRSGGAKPLSALGRELAVTTGGVTRMIDRLERDGLVRRVRSESDRRSVLAEITDAGTRTLLDALPGHVADVRDLLAALDDDQQAALESALRTLRDALGDQPRS
ncbi:MarR family winged helix-turn-helix transcriptional regulator [Nocardioides bruguierae]|uniref:MarR family transcriptional regulator n=1 Tax=Nocardioides bruguierae TaxID=2945102 RepID=A0A9X2IEJ1_9ACTN|nr:MarR family transcriptional regulator [Nocardioides bruguierae]MCM0620886.1 MarR family transcriptional regulator [Nocardioides bruguierae]